MDEVERTTAVADSDADGTTLEDSVQQGTTAGADSAQSQQEEGKAGQPDVSAPSVSDKPSKDPYKELQAKMTRLAQENARLRNVLTPEVVAAMEKGQNVTGRDLLKKRLEENPEIFDDPVSQAEYYGRMNQNQTAAMLTEWDTKREYGEEAKGLIPDLDLKDPALNDAYWKVRREYQSKGFDENPMIAAYQLLNPRWAFTAKREKEKEKVNEVQKRAAARPEKPGTVKEPPKPTEVVPFDPKSFFMRQAERDLGFAKE